MALIDAAAAFKAPRSGKKKPPLAQRGLGQVATEKLRLVKARIGATAAAQLERHLSLAPPEEARAYWRGASEPPGEWRKYNRALGGVRAPSCRLLGSTTARAAFKSAFRCEVRASVILTSVERIAHADALIRRKGKRELEAASTGNGRDSCCPLAKLMEERAIEVLQEVGGRPCICCRIVELDGHWETATPPEGDENDGHQDEGA